MSKLYNTLFKNATRKSPSPKLKSLRYYDKDGDATQRIKERIEQKLDCSESKIISAHNKLDYLYDENKVLKNNLEETKGDHDKYLYNKIVKKLRDNEHFIDTTERNLERCIQKKGGKKTRKNKRHRKTKKAKK
jgi:hypothetical protein